MWDSYDYSGQLALISLVIWLFIIIKYRSVFNIRYTVDSNNNYNIPILLLALFGIFAYAEADTYHLAEGYEYMRRYKEIIQVEPFYFWLIQVLPNNYIIWRAVVWGGASLLMLYTAKCMKLESRTLGFCLALIILSQFAQTRGSLGFSLLMLSLVYISQSHNIFTKVIGITMLALTFFLHKTIPVFILYIPLALLLPLSKKAIIASLIAFPFLYSLVPVMSEKILSFSFLSEMTMEKGISYMGRESTIDGFSTIGVITQIIEFSSIIALFIILTRYYTNRNSEKNKSSALLFKYAYVATYVAFIFYGQDMSDFIHTRSLHFAAFPTLFASVYCFQNKPRKKFDKATMFLLGLNAFINITFHVYKWW